MSAVTGVDMNINTLIFSYAQDPLSGRRVRYCQFYVRASGFYYYLCTNNVCLFKLPVLHQTFHLNAILPNDSTLIILYINNEWLRNFEYNLYFRKTYNNARQILCEINLEILSCFLSFVPITVKLLTWTAVYCYTLTDGP